MSHKRKQAIGYIRTSSATNVGEDKDSDRGISGSLSAPDTTWLVRGRGNKWR